ncbi:MAG: hypothetical protein HY699_10210 [Deltaproteobacteria bacterium]|nr:hypothetical protein [Deltaproteobacteria bacterium]
MRARALQVAALLVTLVSGLPLAVQEGPAAWLARIFDPASLKLEAFAGAQLNRKLSTDAIALERGGTKQIAIYTLPLDQVKAAAEHFGKQLGTKAQIMAEGSPFETHVYDLTGASAPARFKGLRLVISRSQFVDNKGQITLEYTPAAQ